MHGIDEDQYARHAADISNCADPCPLSGVRRITIIFRSRWRMQIEKGVAMPEINTEFLFTIALEIQVSSLGDTPYGGRRIFHFDGGSFEGPKLKGVARRRRLVADPPRGSAGGRRALLIETDTLAS